MTEICSLIDIIKILQVNAFKSESDGYLKEIEILCKSISQIIWKVTNKNYQKTIIKNAKITNDENLKVYLKYINGVGSLP